MNYIRKLFCGAPERSAALSSPAVSSLPTAISSSAVSSSSDALSSLDALSSSDIPSSPAATSSYSDSLLRKVPPEILECIGDFLSPEAVVAFSLSCKHVKKVLGTQPLSQLVTSTKDILVLLELLARDLPNQIVCSPCRRLHDMSNLRRYNEVTYRAGSETHQYHHLRRPACISKDWGDATREITRLFGTAAFEMAIKRYHQDPACTSLVEMMSSKVPEISKSGDYIELVKEDCQVIQGSLIHRLHSAYISSRYLSSNGEIFRFDPPSATICSHVGFGNSVYHRESGLKKCQKCHTDYRIDLKFFKGHGMVMFFTRWKDLGSSPKSWEWRYPMFRCGMSNLRLMFDPRIEVQESMRLCLLVVPRQDGELSSIFGDDGQNFDFESQLTHGDMDKLFHHQKQCWAK